MNLLAPLRRLRPLLLGALLAACGPSEAGQDGPDRVQGAQAQTTGPTRVAPSSSARDPRSGLPPVSAADLPPEGRRILALIRAGGPYPYAKDDSVFGNREGLLPRRERGYYREYTVPTPGEQDRGARRIVCGGPRRTVDGCYYTGDHYRTFRRIRP